MDDWFAVSENYEKKVLVLIIYDIVDNKKRVKLSRYLQGYGFRVQKSAFEALLSHQQYAEMLGGLEQYVEYTDSIRVYKITGHSEVTVIGANKDYACEEVIII